MLALLVQAPKPVAEIPCRVVQNLVLLDVRLNARPAVALLDSGADSTYADADAALAAGAGKGAPVTTTGAGAQTRSGWETKGLALAFVGSSVRRSVARAFALRFPIPGGPKVEAVLGHDLFADEVVEIDYARRQVRLYDPKTYVPPKDARTVPIALERDVPFANLNLALPGASAKPSRLLVDTGVNVGLYLTGAYAGKERLAQRFPDAAPSPDGTGIGGETKSRLLRGVRLVLGGEAVATDAWFDLSTGGEAGSGSRFDGLLGGGVLSRYVVAFDEPHGRVVLRTGKPK